MSTAPAPNFQPRPDPQNFLEPPQVPGDGDLMRRFVSTEDAKAFEGLVRRHGPMVFGTCRRMLRDRHDAEDAFQATFLVLLRKAGSVRPPERVGHWLYGVATRTAAKANTMKLRRRKREENAPPRIESLVGDDREELRSMLDAELARMPERYRAPIVLCELDGMSRREAAAALQLAEGTLSSRLSRARDLLRARLTRRGLTLSAGALVAGLTAEAASASASVPASLVQSAATGTFTSTSIGASSVMGASSDNALVLAKGVMKAMWISKLQTIAVTTVMLGTIGTGATVVTHHVIAREKEAAAAKAGKEGKPPATDTVNTTVIAIDPAAGTITAHLSSEPGKKSPPTTLKLEKDVPVELAGIGKGAATTAGKLADVTPGMSVSLHLSSDKTTVTHILVEGEHLSGTVKAIDAAANTITVEKKDKSGAIEKTGAVHPDARILFAGSGKSKLETPPQAKLSEVAVGARVSVFISADRKSITSITIEGKSINGSVAAVDPAKHTITVSSKGEGGLTEDTFTIAPETTINVDVEGQKAPAPATLAEVGVGMSVNIQTSPRDPKVVTSLQASVAQKNTKGEK
jgi:RNA polymerase sigma factor (sigma-70 family)